jgi:PmbA protein
MAIDLDRWLEAVGSRRFGGIGAAAWSVHAVERRRLSIGTRDGATGNPHNPLRLSESMAARFLVAWEDGKISRGSLERRQITDDTLSALERARDSAYVDPDAARVSGPARFPDVELHDDRVARLIDSELDLLGKRLSRVRETLASNAFRTWSGSIAVAESRNRLVTSKGLDVEDRGTSTGWHVSFNGEWGDGFSARRLDDEQEYERRLSRLAEIVRLLERPEPPMKTGVHPVVLHPHVVETLFLGTLLQNLEGSSVAHDEGFFKLDDFGSDRPALRDDLSLILDPMKPLRSGSYRFTAEGVPADRCEYVSGGRLRTPILDLKYASRLGMEPTPVPYGMDVLELSASESVTERQAYAVAAGGALILSVLGVHTLDSASGDFSLSAPQALILGTDGPRGRIRTTISGNVFAALRDDALRLVDFEDETTPGLLFPCHLHPS